MTEQVLRDLREVRSLSEPDHEPEVRIRNRTFTLSIRIVRFGLSTVSMTSYGPLEIEAGSVAEARKSQYHSLLPVHHPYLVLCLPGDIDGILRPHTEYSGLVPEHPRRRLKNP